MTGWGEGLGPWTPVCAARSCTAAAAPTTATRRSRRSPRSRRCRRRRSPHARCVVLIEACEESGSYDLPAYIEHLAARIGDVEPRRLPRLGLRQLRAAVDARPRCAASSAGRSPSRCCARACTRATRAASCRRASASRARCSRASRTSRPASPPARRSTSTIPRARDRRRPRGREGARRRGLRASIPWLRRRRRADGADSGASCSSTAPGGRRSRSPAPTACRAIARRGQRAAPAAPRSSSRCACRRPATPKRATRA